MPFPKIPNLNDIAISKNDAITLLLASIAFEEFGLSNLINSEAEKIQYAIGTTGGSQVDDAATIDDLLRINNSVNSTLRDIIKTQMLLQFKLEDIINYDNIIVYVNTATVTAVYNDSIYSDSDSAYYYIEGGNSI